MNLIKLTTVILSLSIIGGCGNGEESKSPEPPVQSKKLNVRVIDGYLLDALVWLDVNKDGKRNVDEPQAWTDIGGRASLDISDVEGDLAGYSIISESVKGKTIDADTPNIPVAHSYQMKAPAVAFTAEEAQLVTPLTTLLALKMSAGQSKDEAESDIRTSLKQPDLSFTEDYVAENKTLVAQSAKALVQILPEEFDADLVSENAGELTTAAQQLGNEIAEQRENNEEPSLAGKALYKDKSGQIILYSDSDGDGVADDVDKFPADPLESKDFDNDGIGDNADLDDDNDGVADKDDIFPYDASESVDTDKDGMGNNADLDDDNDGVADTADAFPLDKSESVDTDKDGTGNNADLDDDNDKYLDTDELAAKSDPLDAGSKPLDTDGDFISNVTDADDDNDGVADKNDAFPLDAAESVDSDGDGVGDHGDAFPNDKSETVDTDKDGVGDNADAFPNDVAETADTDQDGTGNNADPDDDNDGVADTADAFPLDRFEQLDTDGDGWGDFASSDNDGDGVFDSVDATPDGQEVLKPKVPHFTEALIYYKREDGNYANWGLHLWNNPDCDSLAGENTNWNAPYLVNAVSVNNGVLFKVQLKSEYKKCLNFIIHNGGNKAQSSDQKVDLTQGNTVYVLDGDDTLYYDVPNADGKVLIKDVAAHWLALDKFAWNGVAGADHYQLWASNNGSTDLTKPDEFAKADLTANGTVNNGVVNLNQYPHLTGKTQYSVDIAGKLIDAATAKVFLKKQLIAVAFDADNKVIAATRVQIPFVLDELYTAGANDADEATLGAQLVDGKAQFTLWAPTAQQVELYLYNANKVPLAQSPIKMTEDRATGIWSYAGDASLLGSFYRYRLQVFHPRTNKVEWLMTTDPYSVSLSTDSRYSQLINFSDDSAKPAGWDTQTIPAIAKPEDNVLYELQIHDFSVSDVTGSKALNGKYLAFTENDRDSVKHLKSLQEAGLTTIHLMPSYDIATLPEEDDKRIDLDDPISKLCGAEKGLNSKAAICSKAASGTIRDVLQGLDPSSGDAQQLMADIRPIDGYNFGYDPYHYNTPEGSYASESDGVSRVKEYRTMVKTLHDMGFRVIQDVVYNHTYGSGLYNTSVLDKVVPGYYHRLNADNGYIERSTCCDNTAPEHRMFEKLMIDGLVMWAKDYKIDGFRFDLMGFLMRSNVEKAFAAVKKVDPDTWFYAEGWDFGETANKARGVNGTQWNMAGSGFGSYNDRIRDAVRGDGGDTMNAIPGTADAGNKFTDKTWQSTLNEKLDLVRLGMTGSLQEYPLPTASGATVLGKNYDYKGTGAGYAMDPQESVNYVSKHDNQTLWDIIQYKAAGDISIEDRARMQILGMAPIMWGQGVPFMQMGVELLRSKSMERDSYDSGDWFNKVDFTKQTNNWNVGLPRKDKDGSNWGWIKAITANADKTTPTASNIAWNEARFKEMLTIRRDSALLRLGTTAEVIKRVKFHNTGPGAKPGTIVMTIDDGVLAGEDLDPNYEALAVAINASPWEQVVNIPGAKDFELHPLLVAGNDPRIIAATTGSDGLHIPGYTAVVFVKKQGAGQGNGMDVAPLNEDIFLRGTFNGWDTSLNLAYIGKGRYQVDATLAAGESYQFKVAAGEWAAPHPQYNAVNLNAGVGSMPWKKMEEDNKLEVTAVAAGDYRFILDLSNLNNPRLTVVSPDGTLPPYGNESLSILNTPIEYKGDGVYQGAKYLQPGVYDFSVGSIDPAVFTAGNSSIEFTYLDNGEIRVTLAKQGLWDFKIDASDFSNQKLSVSYNKNFACYDGDGNACDLRMYQVMVESFVDGDPDIGYSDAYGPSAHGGDLQGIINSLDYIKGLNVNAIWLTPVFDSSCAENTDQKLNATGYFACDFFKVDPNFGSADKLKELIAAAHAKGLYVFLDGVFGHVGLAGVSNPSPNGISPVLTDVAVVDGVAYPGKLVDYSKADSLAYFKEVAVYWIREFGIDGWRLDQAYQPPLSAWREIRKVVEAAALARKDAGNAWGTLGYMVGEVWKGADEIKDTAYGPDENPALSSAFDFPRRYGVVQALAVGEDGTKANARALDADWNNIGHYPLHAMPNLMLGNHDLVRFGDLLQRGGFAADEYWLRHKAAFSYLGAWSGPITLYYGEEIGDQLDNFATKFIHVDGGDYCDKTNVCDDHVSRTTGKISGLSAQEEDLKTWLSKLLNVRAQHKALYAGERINLWVDDTLYVDLKQTETEQIIYLLNTGTIERSFTFYDSAKGKLADATQLKDLISGEIIDGIDSVAVPALTGRFLLVE